MKKHWIQKHDSPNLILYFSGWGMDHAAVESLELVEDDICVVYDYTDLSNFEESDFKSYQSIRLIAWSMGVWVAAFLLQNSELKITQAIAVNGTPRPIDDQFGIPEAVFLGTLNGLSADSLPKFDRRMCGSKAVYQQFVHISRSSSINALKFELQNIYDFVMANPQPQLKWTKALIGQTDMIFPASNQKYYWNDLGEELDMPHFPFFVCNKWSDF